MPNRSAHSVIGGVAVGLGIAYADSRNKTLTLKPVAGGVIAALSSSLPDMLEPAIHPHHRQFFHSLAFGTLLGYGAYKLYKWEPTEEAHKIARYLLLIILSAYLLHLLMDSFTSKSIPLIGKL